MRFHLTWLLVLSLGTPWLPGQDADACGVCHSSLYREWLQSRHSQSWKSPDFQAQMERFGSREFCGRCHAAASIWEDLDMRPDPVSGKEPESFQPRLRERGKVREKMLEEGVSCKTCHHIEVLWATTKGPETVGPFHTEAGHGGKQVSEFSTFEVCGACHGRPQADYMPQRAQGAAGYHHSANVDFEFAFANADCAGCHMPRSEGPLVQLKIFKNLPERMVGRHDFIGKRYAQLSKALEFKLEEEGSGRILKVTNLGLGHPLRISSQTSYVIHLTGAGEAEHRIDLPASDLAAGQSLQWELPETLGRGEIRLQLFRRTPAGFEEPLFNKAL